MFVWINNDRGVRSICMCIMKEYKEYTSMRVH